MRLPLLAGVLLLLPMAVAAQATPPPNPCTAAEYHVFDFWTGEWTVTDPQGATVGSNVIRSVSGGCALLESWTDARGTTGTSINYYDPRTQRWTQVWVGEGGSILHLQGGIVDGVMELGGERQAPDGTRVRDRIRWTPNQDGTVRQHWEISRDQGETWETLFDGVYKRKG